jgi:hypothetical protein
MTTLIIRTGTMEDESFSIVSVLFILLACARATWSLTMTIQTGTKMLMICPSATEVGSLLKDPFAFIFELVLKRQRG